MAALLIGLPAESRIKKKITDRPNYTLQEILLMHILDTLQIQVWLNTKNGQKGINKPKSLYKKLCETEKKNISSAPTKYKERTDFDKAWNNALRKEK